MKRKHKKYRSYVYFIQAKTGGPVKIGVGDDPHTRLRQLNTGSDEELVILRTFGFHTRQKTFDMETYLHRRFHYCNLRLEWFTLTPGLLFYCWTHLVFPRFKLTDILLLLWHL
jgi:hypothetical protein